MFDAIVSHGQTIVKWEMYLALCALLLFTAKSSVGIYKTYNDYYEFHKTQTISLLQQRDDETSPVIIYQYGRSDDMIMVLREGYDKVV
jgi:hypothetical protein